MVEFKFYWDVSKSVEVHDIDGRLYALSGWDGEVYSDSWETNENRDIVKDKITIRPVYCYEVDGIAADSFDESSDNYDDLIEIVDYKVV